MRTGCGRIIRTCDLVSTVRMISSRQMEECLRDRGSTYGAVHVWCGVAECQRVISFVDVLSVVSCVAYVEIERLLNKCVRTTCF